MLLKLVIRMINQTCRRFKSERCEITSLVMLWILFEVVLNVCNNDIDGENLLLLN